MTYSNVECQDREDDLHTGVQDLEIAQLTAELAELKTWRKDTNLELDKARKLLNKAIAMITEKDKRIEELELDLKQRDRIIDKRESHIRMLIEKSGHIITEEQVDAAWMLVVDTGEDGRVNSGAKQALARIGIVECEECEGRGHYQEIDRFNWVECSCCNGHRWIKTSPLVDKCGHFGTEEDER